MSHDYQPSWDYPVVELQEIDAAKDHSLEIQKAIADATQELTYLLGFEEFEVFYVEPGGLTNGFSLHDAVAVYCNGTSSRPVIGIDVATLAEICEHEGLDFSKEFRTCIAHELVHAYQETLGIEHYEDEEEDEAEVFAKLWGYDGTIDLPRLQMLDPHNMREIMFACANLGRTKSIEAILVAYPHIKDQQTFNSKTALHIAAETGNIEMCHLLIEKQARLDSPSHQWQTPLHIAAQRGHDQVVEILLRAGASIQATDEKKRSALHLAAAAEHLQTCKTLLSMGADLHAKDKAGIKPLDPLNTSQTFCERLQSSIAQDAISTSFTGEIGDNQPKKQRKGPSL